MTPNQKAFLDMIAFSEGTSRIGHNQGYDVLVGGGLFTGYSDHPRKLVFLPNLFNQKTGKRGLYSSAAGRYQILARYYDAYKKLLKLPDFSPASQDAIALCMISEQGASQDVIDGDLEDAIGKCRNIWASLPSAGYGQREQKLSSLQEAYLNAGGALA